MERAGGAPDTTNNRMELQAAIEGLKALLEPCEVLLFTDSRYLLEAFELASQVACERMGSPAKDEDLSAANSDLWKELDQLAEKHVVKGSGSKGTQGTLTTSGATNSLQLRPDRTQKPSKTGLDCL